MSIAVKVTKTMMMTTGLHNARICSSVGLYTNCEWRLLWSLFALQWACAKSRV